MPAIELVDDWSPAVAPLPPSLLERYLERIAIRRPDAPTEAALAEVLWAHLSRFPFENFEALLGRPVALDPESLVAKFVDGQRGGYCFEQNMLLGGALTAIGFPVRLLGARGILGASEPRPRTHLALLVDLPDGERRIVDAGFGRATLRAPLALEPGVVQQLGRDEYRLVDRDGERAVQTRRAGAADWVSLYLLDPRPLLPIDVEMANHFVATHPKSHMKERAIVLRPLATGKRSLVGRRLVIEEDRRRIDRELEPDEIDAVLREEFGIVLPEPFGKAPG